MDPGYPKQATFGGKRSHKGVRPPQGPPQYSYTSAPYGASPQLFDDTSASSYPSMYPQLPQQDLSNWTQSYNPATPFPGQQLLTDPMASIAMQYGQTLAGQGKVIVEQKIEKYVSMSKMKYYFAVDTGYVMKKLSLLFFPFTHKEWGIHFDNQNEPLMPRYDINAPDLYIPSMAFVTYVLIAGYILGSQNRFSPEQLGMQASSALGWSMVEIIILYLALYLLSATSSLRIFDLISFCSYKYVCMVAVLLSFIVCHSGGYFALLAYSSLSLGYFLLRTLRMIILPKTTTDHYNAGGRHNSYLLLGICVLQPVLMYILTKHLVISTKINTPV